jgi:catalase
MTDKPASTTTDSGIPVPSDEHALTAGQTGPVLLHDYYLNEKLAHFVRERVPDRVYHVKGGGAFGYFEVTTDVSQWTKAAFLSQVGKRTPCSCASRSWRQMKAPRTPTATFAVSP